MQVLGVLGIVLVLWAAYKLLGVVFRLIQGLLALGVGLYLMQSAGLIRGGKFSLDPQGLVSWMWQSSHQLWILLERLAGQVAVR